MTDQSAAAARTDGNTPWIWLHLFVPVIAIVPVFFIDWRRFLIFDVNDPSSVFEAQLAVFLSPAYLLTILASTVAYALTVVFAALDHRELVRRQVPRPFHWAFAFLSNYVYVIGRTVVLVRRTGRGYAPLWVAIGLFVVAIVASVIFTVWLMVVLFEQFPVVSVA